LTHKFFGHFREPALLYYPDERWGTQVPFPPDSLDWRRIVADYDYIVVAGLDPGARAAVASHADLVARENEFALYRVLARPEGPEGAPPHSAARGAVHSAARTPALAWPASLERSYTHPGVFYTQDQLAFVIAKIRAHEQPWSSAFDQLMASAGRERNREPHAMQAYNVPGYYQDQAAFFAA